jgi:hypothetical protein
LRSHGRLTALFFSFTSDFTDSDLVDSRGTFVGPNLCQGPEHIPAFQDHFHQPDAFSQTFGSLRRYEHFHLPWPYVRKYAPPTCHFHLPVPFEPGTVRAFHRSESFAPITLCPLLTSLMRSGQVAPPSDMFDSLLRRVP